MCTAFNGTDATCTCTRTYLMGNGIIRTYILTFSTFNTLILIYNRATVFH